MRIVYVNADPGIPIGGPKGGSVHIVEMLHALVEIGARVRVLSARVDEHPDDLHKMQIDQVNPGPGRSSAGLNRQSKEHNYQLTADAICEQLIKSYQEQPFDCIYERYSLWSDAGVRAASALGVPCIVEVNAPLVDEQRRYRRLFDERRARQIERTVLGQADHLVIVSEELRDVLCQSGAGRARTTVVGNGVNLNRFNADRVLTGIPMEENIFTAGFTGSLKNWHGIRELMQAFSMVRQQVPQARLLIVGDGPKRQWLEGFAEGAGLSSVVEVTGWVPHAELPALLARMDVAVAPYPDDPDHYFSPLKLFEYLAMGRPVVASRIGQISRLLRHGENAWLVKPGSPAALAEGMLTLQRDTTLARKLREGGLRVASENTWKRNARLVTDLADMLVKRQISA